MNFVDQWLPGAAPPVVLEFAHAADAATIAKLHAQTRLDCDVTMQDYVRAAVAEGYFDRQWAQCPALAETSVNDKVIKASLGGSLVGFVRFGAIDAPADMLAPGEAGMAWGELHQIYVALGQQGRGVGGRLFAAAVDGLRAMTVRRMAINVLRDNQAARAFYERRGAACRAEIVEHNRRNGVVYNVPCALYALAL